MKHETQNQYKLEPKGKKKDDDDDVNDYDDDDDDDASHYVILLSLLWHAISRIPAIKKVAKMERLLLSSMHSVIMRKYFL